MLAINARIKMIRGTRISSNTTCSKFTNSEEINYRVSFGVCEFFNRRNGQISTNIPTAPPISAPGMLNKLPPKNAPPQDEERAAEIIESQSFFLK